MKRLTAVLAVALLVVAACKGGGSSAKFPSKVWEGGTPVVVEVENGVPARLWAFFETNVPGTDPKHKLLEVSEEIPAGKHRFTVDIPRAVGGSIGVSAKEAPVGSKMAIALEVGGRKGASDSYVLEEPLRAGSVHGAMLEIDEFVSGR